MSVGVDRVTGGWEARQSTTKTRNEETLLTAHVASGASEQLG